MKQKLQEFFIKYPSMRWAVLGLCLGTLCLGAYTLGAIVVCEAGGGVVQGGIVPSSCVGVDVVGVCEYQQQYYVPTYTGNGSFVIPVLGGG